MFIALTIPGHSHMLEMTLGRPNMVVGVIMTATSLSHTHCSIYIISFSFHFNSFLLICLYFVALVYNTFQIAIVKHMPDKMKQYGLHSDYCSDTYTKV
ncbi:hypothetical protein BDV27DRAFT_116951 [Aspergillus caelatus]|uniref:Uncharacterized protein n=2 Tax=Aspergillus subgen. Circumdati TaxID=2720871 RepID=A0A5N7A3M6_9EURO|nr:uncharacterized protein BDV27DRAFT_116951 [Aspergillus caelatus]KAE8364183.1 hypothetical protein BDV27DRAFT_116951 [Aspergillus caelatus]KAE8417783.1 hypothetical protein BDV36DRAFT_172067 [Aspergillus pseudocaelatus]